MKNNKGFTAWVARSRFAAMFVELPEKIKGMITAVVVALFSAGFVWLLGLIPWLSFLDPYVGPLALAVAAALIKWIENAIPGAYSEIAIQAIYLLLLVLAAFGVGGALASQGVAPAFFAPLLL